MNPAPTADTVADDAARRAAMVRYFRSGGSDAGSDHDMYHEDAILEFPQSGERFIGLRQFQEWRAQYPGKVDYRIRRMTGSGDLWINEILLSYDCSPPTFGVAIVQFRGDKIARETIYVADGWDAADWRAPWATRFDPLASVSVADWEDGMPFGLEAELEETLRSR